MCGRREEGREGGAARRGERRRKGCGRSLASRPGGSGEACAAGARPGDALLPGRRRAAVGIAASAAAAPLRGKGREEKKEGKGAAFVSRQGKPLARGALFSTRDRVGGKPLGGGVGGTVPPEAFRGGSLFRCFILFEWGGCGDVEGMRSRRSQERRRWGRLLCLLGGGGMIWGVWGGSEGARNDLNPGHFRGLFDGRAL